MTWVWLGWVALIPTACYFAGAYFFGADFGGMLGLVMGSPLLGYPVWRVATALGPDGARAMKAHALRPVMGRFYAYHGTPVRVLEDEDDERWVGLADVRRVVPGLARDDTLARMLPHGVWRPEGEGRTFGRVDELMALIGRSQTDRTSRFREWLRREVYLPSRAAQRRGEGPLAPRSQAPGPIRRED